MEVSLYLRIFKSSSPAKVYHSLKGFKINSCLLLLLLAGNPLFLFGQRGGPSAPLATDTTQAIVLYGDRFLFDPLRFNSDPQLIEYLDSLLGAPSIPIQLIEEITLFMEIRNKRDVEINHLIDSLFNLENIPYALINQVNYFKATRDFGYNARRKELESNLADYAVFDFYEGWDLSRPHPYYDPSGTPDSSVTLRLADSMLLCQYQHPVSGVVTSHFGWRDGRPHNGTDIDLVTGDPVRAAFDGVVRIAARHGGYGNLVVVRHHNGLETYYAHLHRFKVKPGQSVQAGQIIATGGNTGHSSGSHLHFEVRFRGIPINPRHLISFATGDLHSEAIVITKSRSYYQAYPEGTEFHKVNRGESLSLIATRYGLSINKLCEINRLSRKSVLRVGQKLRVTS